MKQATIFLLLLLFSLSLCAQKQVSKAVNAAKSYTKPQSVSALNRATVLEPLDRTLTERNTAVQLVADEAVLKQIERTKPTFLEFSIPVSANETMVLELIPNDIFGDKFQVLNAQNEAVNVDKGVFYKGIVKGDDNSIVSLALTNGELSGIISNNQGNYVLGKMKSSRNDNVSNYIFYNDHELLEKSKFDCAVEETIEHHVEQTRQTALTETLVCSPRPVQIYFEADNSIFTAQGSNMTTATAFVNALFGQVAVLYANEGIAIQISQLKIWDTADPYISAGGFYATHQMLNLFVAQVGTTFTGDLAHLISARVLGGGVADSFESLCNKGAAISANITSTVVNVPVYSWNVLVVTHELGHNFGSPHTHSCFWPGGAIDNCEFTEGGCWSGPAPVNGGTIMSYCHQVKGVGINFANGFGPLPGNMIRSRANFCIYTSKLEVTVISTSANTTAACNGFQIVVSATGGTGAKTFSVSPNVGSQAVSGTFTGLSPGTYVFTTTDANGCTATISTTIPAPAAPTVQTAVAICNNDNTSITATSSGNTIKWYDATGTNELFTGATFTTPNLIASTAYKVRSQGGGGACFSPFVDVAVTVNPKPAAPVITQSAGTNCGTVTLTSNVPNSNALNFVKASSQYVTVPHSASINLGATFTMEAWVRYSGANSTIVDKGDYDFLWSLNANSNGNKMGFYNKSTGAWKYSIDAVPENTWTHVAITLNAGTLTFYINGVASGTATVSFSQDNQPMNIGRQQPTACVCNHFNGTMDELRLWNVARTAAQLQASKDNSISSNSAGLVAYYKFDEATGATTADATSNGNTGTLMGATRQMPATSPINAVVWSPSGVRNRSIETTTSGTYTATTTNEFGCPNTANTVVTVNGLSTMQGFINVPYTNYNVNNTGARLTVTSSAGSVGGTAAVQGLVVNRADINTVDIRTDVQQAFSTIPTANLFKAKRGVPFTITVCVNVFYTAGGPQGVSLPYDNGIISYPTLSGGKGRLTSGSIYDAFVNLTNTNLAWDNVQRTYTYSVTTTLNNADATSFLLFKIPQINNLTGVTHDNMLVLPFVVECETPDFTWSGSKSTDWMDAANWSCNAVPTATDDVTIPSSIIYGATLTMPVTVKSVTLQGFNKITLGNHNLTVNSITGSPNGYVVTNGTGGLIIKNVSVQATTFPVGPSTSIYAPAIVTNNVARDFTVRVGTTLTNAAVLSKVINLQWDVTPSVSAGNSATLAFGWPASSQNGAFSPTANVYVGHYNTTLSAWDRFCLAIVTGNDPYVATVSGVDAFSPFAIGGLNALSVELLDFKGTPQYNGNFLTWETANEVNNKGFQVERLMDNGQLITNNGQLITNNGQWTTNNGQWITLGFVKSKSKAETYQFVDNQPSTTSYYCLRQMDNGGKETLSKVISIERKPKTSVLNVYPNPAHNSLTIDYLIDVQKESEQYTVVNTLGQMLLQGKLSSNSLDISSLPTGAFIIKIGEGQAKFFKQ